MQDLDGFKYNSVKPKPKKELASGWGFIPCRILL